MATDAEKINMLSANQQAAIRGDVVAARRAARSLGTFSQAAMSGLGLDYSAAPGMQSPTLMQQTGLLGRSIVGDALSQQEAFKKLLALRKLKGYQSELSGGALGAVGGIPSFITPPVTTTVPITAG
jgi:hypothetical protein